MKTIKSLLLTFMLLLCLTAQAQWAGEDKVVLRELDNSQTVSIGVQGSSTEICYEWTSHPTIVSTDLHQAVIVVNPQAPEETYICTRTSSCGVEQDMVKVKVLDSISIVSVTPLKNCYNSGDQVELSHFEIETYPPGYGTLVQFSPDHVYNNWGLYDADEETITFELSYNNHTSRKTATVNVYNENQTITYGESYDFVKLVHQIEAINNMVKKAKGITDKLNSFAKGISPCSPDFHLVATRPQATVIRTCCNDEQYLGFKLDLPYYDVFMAIDCYIPTTLKIPVVGGVDIHVGAAVGARLGPLSAIYKGKCSNISITVGAYANVSGGVRVSVADPDFLSGELNLVGEGGTNVTWVLGEAIDWHPVDVSLKIVGKVMALSFFTKQIEFQICSHTFFN